MAQVDYHVTENAETIVRKHVQLSEYTTERPQIYETLIEMYYTLGRALTQDKKYPSLAYFCFKSRFCDFV